MDIVAVDIGGTNARFAMASWGADGAIQLGEPVILDPHAHASFETAWAHFAEIYGAPLPKAAALAMAAPVDRDEITFANIAHWTIHREGLAARLAVEAITLVNDFGAMGHAVAHAGASDFTHLAGPERDLPASGTISVIGPGTGLGVAHVWRDASLNEGRGFYHVQSTEGGHTDFAPLDAIEDALLARLRQRHRRVSTERVVSGPAIVDIYETLAALEGRAIVPAQAPEIWRRAASGEDPLAAAARDRFCLSLGSVAGDLALAQGATGVVIAGGVAQRLGAQLIASGFAERFRAKGRFESLMAAIPVKLITHPQPGLLGAAAAFQKDHCL